MRRTVKRARMVPHFGVAEAAAFTLATAAGVGGVVTAAAVVVDVCVAHCVFSVL